MKAIQTEYNGILYRSKLEAKWAAYFDLCGACFSYEPEAFDLGGGVKYLPDFLVMDVRSVHGECGFQTLENSHKFHHFWFECKGIMEDYDKEKIVRFRATLPFPTPFYILDQSPLEMFYNFDNSYDSFFEFGCIDGDDDFPFVIGKPSGINGLGLFGADSNYLCLMDAKSREFADQVERMFRWSPNK